MHVEGVTTAKNRLEVFTCACGFQNLILRFLLCSFFSTQINHVTDEMQEAGSKIAGLALKCDSKLIPAALSH